MSDFKAKKEPNSISVGALSQTPLGSLQRSPDADGSLQLSPDPSYI